MAKEKTKEPVRGWVRPAGRRGRWIEPFVLLLIAEGPVHGYSVISQLNKFGLTRGRLTGRSVSIGPTARAIQLGNAAASACSRVRVARSAHLWLVPANMASGCSLARDARDDVRVDLQRQRTMAVLGRPCRLAHGRACLAGRKDEHERYVAPWLALGRPAVAQEVAGQLLDWHREVRGRDAPQIDLT